MLAVLTDRRLAALVAGYVQRHGLAYSVRFLTWQRNNRACEVAWFDLVQAREVRPIPAFVINFLQRLTRTTLLTDVAIHPDDTPDLEHEPPCRVLIAWGQRTPLYLPHIEGILPSNSALLLAGRSWGAGLVHPLPSRQQMQQITRVRMPAPARVSVSERPAGQLQLPLVLVRDGSTPTPVHGLLLDTPALERLRRLVRHLPVPWFAQARIATGEGVALVLAPDAAQPIRGIPVGQPLSRADQPGVLLPRGMLLRPSLPPDLLAPVLDLQNDTLTVLTPTCRYDAPLEAFQPVSTLLALDMPASSVRIVVQPSTLPAIDLSDLLEDPPAPAPAPPPPREKVEKEEEPPPKEGLRSIVHGLLGRGVQGSTAPAPDLRRHAGRLQQEGHYAAAAVFYDYLGETGKAKTCYQQAVEQGKQKTP
jgi:hypothetical protein